MFLTTGAGPLCTQFLGISRLCLPIQRVLRKLLGGAKAAHPLRHGLQCRGAVQTSLQSILDDSIVAIWCLLGHAEEWNALIQPYARVILARQLLQPFPSPGSLARHHPQPHSWFSWLEPCA